MSWQGGTLDVPLQKNQAPLEGSMKMQMVVHAIGHAERASALALSLHGLLEKAGLVDLARMAWVAHLEAQDAAEELGAEAEIEVAS